MNRILIGLVIGGVILFIIYYNKKERYKTPTSIVKKDPLAKDIVLAKLNNKEYAILWNSTPGTTYNYSIHTPKGVLDNNEKAIEGTITASSGVVKIKGISLLEGEKYRVVVNETIIDHIEFDPPSVVEEQVLGSGCEIKYNDTPTNIEILINNQKLPLEYISIYPGDSSIKADFGEHPKENIEVIIMVYKGPNVVNILTRSLGE